MLAVFTRDALCIAPTYRRAQRQCWLRLRLIATYFFAHLVQRRLWEFHRQVILEVQLSWKDICDDSVLNKILLSFLCTRHRDGVWCGWNV
jgi:hypothetical protein